MFILLLLNSFLYNKMNLHNLIDDTRTDKNTVHSYIPLYEKLLRKKKRYCQKYIRNWYLSWW